MGRGLSELQKTILVELRAETERMNEAWQSLGYIEDNERVDCIPQAGFRKTLSQKLSYPEPSISRAITRLEKRGLIIREKEYGPYGVNNWVELTEVKLLNG